MGGLDEKERLEGAYRGLRRQDQRERRWMADLYTLVNIMSRPDSHNTITPCPLRSVGPRPTLASVSAAWKMAGSGFSLLELTVVTTKSKKCRRLCDSSVRSRRSSKLDTTPSFSPRSRRTCPQRQPRVTVDVNDWWCHTTGLSANGVQFNIEFLFIYIIQ